jgi:hypothetical protein
MTQIWTSMVKVAGDRSNLILRGHTGAYVWMVARASNLDEFQARLAEELRRFNLSLVSLEEVSTADEAEARDDLSHELLALIAKVRDRPDGCAHGVFYSFHAASLPSASERIKS